MMFQRTKRLLMIRWPSEKSNGTGSSDSRTARHERTTKKRQHNKSVRQQGREQCRMPE